MKEKQQREEVEKQRKELEERLRRYEEDFENAKRGLNKSSAVAEMGDHLATIGMGRKWGGAAVGAGSPLGPHLTQCGLDQGLPLCQVAS